MSVTDETDVERCAAGVADDDVVAEVLESGKGDASDRRHRWARADRVNWLLDKSLDRGAAPGGRADQHFARETGLAQVGLKLAQVLLHQGFQRGVDRGRRGSTVFANNGDQLVRERVGS